MGFFSSRKDENNKPATDTQEKSVVRVIRSRFYGKSKPRGHVDPEPVSFYAPPSAQQALSPPARQTHRHTTQPSSSKSPPTPKRSPQLQDSSIRPKITTASTRRSPLSSEPVTPKSSNASPILVSRPPPATSDNVSITLAQRLNDLAKANAEGLLSDEDYRILRKDLFERLATNAPVPSESSVVPVLRPRPMNNPSMERPNSIRHSRIVPASPRPPSVRSKNSPTSSVRGFFGRMSQHIEPHMTKEGSDTTSFISSKSAGLSNIFRLSRALSRKGSQSSLNTDMSQPQADAISITSRRTDRSQSDYTMHISPMASRSNAANSVRRLATPPSSFNARIGPGSSSGHSTSPRDASHVFDDDHLVSSQDIQKEILIAEAEKQNLMDSFNSLELATITRRQRNEVLPSQNLSPGPMSGEPRASFYEENRSRYAPDSETASMRSHWSFGTSHSVARSMSSRKTGSSSVHRLAVGSSTRSRDVPPVPALPSDASTSMRSARRRPSPVGESVHESIAEDESVHTIALENDFGFEQEMGDLMRRREEVRSRYEARLQYLRAKLKGAQLHEKLVKRR
ncbi:hypothetical protein HGRIS_005854 [Hohenbuehelia grisea]|uniref:Uncharacterized protein n=1 Tax=Hohenbuehelia grisea TaxID=104357 RepID=A0ABR3K0D9_9AGAR